MEKKTVGPLVRLLAVVPVIDQRRLLDEGTSTCDHRTILQDCDGPTAVDSLYIQKSKIKWKMLPTLTSLFKEVSPLLVSVQRCLD